MKLFFIALGFFTSLTISAQPQKENLKTITSFKDDIEKVVLDYFENFNTIKGEIIIQSNNIIEYQSKIIPVGALKTIIIKYPQPNSYSWESVMLTTENFEEASLKYKQYYYQLSGATFKFRDGTIHNLTGTIEAPSGNKKFASGILEFKDENSYLQYFKIEVAINYLFPEWSVKVMVYEKVPDEKIRPALNN